MINVSRRTFVQGIACAGLVMSGACSRRPPASEQAGQSLRWANLAPGFTIFMTEYIRARQLAQAHGVRLATPTSYASVSTYYNDFVAGNYDVSIAGWDTVAARYLAKVPIRMVCNLTTASMIGLLAPSDGADSIGALEGKTIAAPQSTSTYRIARALISEVDGLDIEKSAVIQNVDNPAASVSMVMGRRADCALTWEPNISAGLLKDPSVRAIYNVGDVYRRKFGVDLPFFGVAARAEVLDKDPQLAARLDAMFGQAVQEITADPKRAVELAGKLSGVGDQTLMLAIQSGRMGFQHLSMREEQGRKVFRTASAFLERNGLLPGTIDDGIFAA